MKNRIFVILLSLGIGLQANAWDWWPLPTDGLDIEKDSIIYDVELSALASSGRYAPFLLQSNRNGNISAAPHSANASVYIGKPATRPHRWYDYDFGVEYTVRYDYHKKLNYYFNQLYAHTRLYIIDITAGITPYSQGPQDPELSSGGLLFSNNAMPMPRISIGIDEWRAFPGFYGFLEFKGGITHGWFIDNTGVRKSYLHHTFAGARVGGKLPFHLSYEFHHAAQWGGYSEQYGDLGNNFKAFGNALLAKSGGNMANDQLNAQGNHIGSQILTLELNGSTWTAKLYWQNLSEDGPIKFMTNSMNIYDGLWGFNLTLHKWPFINGFTYEFLNTTDQSGPYHDKDGLVYGGNDSYFRNSVYINGWNYFMRTIETPYITSPLYNENGELMTLNNRVQMHFAGIKGDIYGYRYRVMGSYCMNYGQYKAPLSNHNTALLLEVKKQFKKAWGIEVGLTFSADIGNQFGNSYGGMITIGKRGLIADY